MQNPTQNLTVSIPHQLTRAEVKQRIQEQIGQLRHQQGNLLGGLHGDWHGDTMHFSVGVLGQSLAGQLHVEDRVVRVEVALPWFLALLAGTVRQRIEQQGRLLLNGCQAT